MNPWAFMFLITLTALIVTHYDHLSDFIRARIDHYLILQQKAEVYDLAAAMFERQGLDLVGAIEEHQIDEFEKHWTTTPRD